MKKISMFCGIVLMALLVVSSTSVPLQGSIPSSERAALIAFYNAANGDNWIVNRGWKGNNNEPDGFSQIGSEGSWYGITVTSVSGDHVTAIKLSNNQLNGTISPELGKLKYLESLMLFSNQLSGTIPSTLGNLSNLHSLYLDNNQLSGSIPSELGLLSHLKGIYLYANQLSGTIPSELGNLSNLEYLRLDANQLSGSIPSSLTNLTNLSSNWTDIGYNALYANDSTLRTFLNSKDSNWEDTQTIAPTNVSAAALSISSIAVSWTPITYTGDTGGYKVYYSTTSGGPYTFSGMTADKSITSYDITGLSSSTTYYVVVKTQTDSHGNNENTVESEYSEETFATTQSLPETDPPFGTFETPIDGSTVASSIPVSGWALDETGIDSLKIYRAQGNSLVYIGDAVFVEGARPDVAQLYPVYPNNTKAGWGYMLLTNFLPNGGNGTFVIHAIATDLVGKTTTLGTKTIHCDNANAVKPFGAIDTPTQGGTASGSSFINWGWALTPQPNSIPADGSTIQVYVDGINLGHPTYNIYRADIASLFPGYANSNGAIGFFNIDTTAYTNGVHTIYWTAEDSGGNVDGIGSRYFTIQNSGASSVASGQWPVTSGKHTLSKIPIDDSSPVEVIKGFNKDVEPLKTYPDDDNGFITVEIQELERIEIYLNGYQAEVNASVNKDSSNNSKFKIQNSKFYHGYQVTGNQLTSLPIGSTLDTKRGIFYWAPGPGFIREYHFVFVEIGKNGIMSKKYLIVRIVPKFSSIGDTW
jgi:hypothetical protein